MPSSSEERGFVAASAADARPKGPFAPAVAAALVVVSTWASRGEAQPQPQGFAVERYYPAAPGGGWMVMDDLAMRGGLGGAIGIAVGYARNPLRVRTSDGSEQLTVVSDQAFADIGIAVTYDCYRLYLNLDSPLSIRGDPPGTIGGYRLTAPSVSVGSNPDTISDFRIGFDTRLLGSATSPLRLGAGAQLIIPSGDRANYLTDGTYRGMVRALFAGEVGRVTYAWQVGVHIRPLDDSPAPGSPQGSELIFGVAAGPEFPLGGTGTVVVGPEIYGETAFRSFLRSTATGLEGLLTGRFEDAMGSGPQLRVKLGTGGGIHPYFGAPEWRIVVALEVVDHLRRAGGARNPTRPAETPGITQQGE